MQLRQAQKSISKLRIGLAGPSGSGKTYSALLLASGMTKWDKICVIDTENNSADLYSDLGKYNVITLEAPFTPEKYVAAIKECESAGMEVIIIDSITHEWSEAKNMVDKLGGRFQDWAKVTPIHDRFVTAIVSSKCHIITTVRSKVDYAMTTENGKTKVQKVGLKAEAREGFEYELTVSFDLNISHLAEASKDRTGIFMDGDPGTITKEYGKKLLKWSNTGVDPTKLAKEIEALLPTKETDWTAETLAAKCKVSELSELKYSQLISIKAKVDALPPKKEKIDPPATPPSSPNDAVSVDDIPDDLGTKPPAIDPMAALESAEKDTRSLPMVEMASPGDVKMFGSLLNRRAELKGIDPTDFTMKFLAAIKVESPELMTKDQIRKLNDRLIEENARIVRPSAKVDPVKPADPAPAPENKDMSVEESAALLASALPPEQEKLV